MLLKRPYALTKRKVLWASHMKWDGKKEAVCSYAFGRMLSNWQYALTEAVRALKEAVW